MRTFRIALAQVNATVGDIDGNTQLCLDAIASAKAAGADLVALPEMVLTGYPPEDLLLKPSFIAANMAALDKVAAEANGICAVVGYAHLDSDLRNAAAVCHDGVVKGIYRKHFLPNYGVFDEDRYFAKGMQAPVFEVAGTSIGVCICEDIWYASGPAEWQSWAGAELIVNINGSPYHDGKLAGRRNMLSTRASDYVVALAYVNLVGGQDELVFDGGSMVMDADGQLIAASPQFESDLLVVDVDIDAVARERLHDPRARKVSEPPVGIETPLVHLSGPQVHNRESVSAPIAPLLSTEAEVWHALVVGVRDYVRKNGVSEVLIGLSGGIDSALTAAVAVDAIGGDKVTGVLMSSRWSSKHSRDDAYAVAQSLGIRTLDLDIEAPHIAFESVLGPHIDNEPGAGLAHENIQPRIRGIYLLALSNARVGSIVLTTGNKSELATGYSTLYGDMAGGFAVLKDVSKTMVYRLANYRNSIGEVIPADVITKPPSAELRPDQKDSDSLPSYDVLDPILEAYVEQDRSPDEIVGLGYDVDVVRRVISLVDRAEYKRRQAPPGIKITPRAFGRDRRLPITNRFKER